ncbi:hypothetical protein KFK09_027267 [Dendrobium nobile]|uniref:Uncharacterized protein n=1 Tax=Dendrobium nobile TaxID=94219 RepID=A0A8T3AAM2_DENNO|nr:hypothetical protein KFK09_027267 [Dendrobium nobile]
MTIDAKEVSRVVEHFDFSSALHRDHNCDQPEQLPVDFAYQEAHGVVLEKSNGSSSIVLENRGEAALAIISVARRAFHSTVEEEHRKDSIEDGEDHMKERRTGMSSMPSSAPYRERSLQRLLLMAPTTGRRNKTEFVCRKSTIVQGFSFIRVQEKCRLLAGTTGNLDLPFKGIHCGSNLSYPRFGLSAETVFDQTKLQPSENEQHQPTPANISMPSIVCPSSTLTQPALLWHDSTPTTLLPFLLPLSSSDVTPNPALFFPTTGFVSAFALEEDPPLPTDNDTESSSGYSELLTELKPQQQL